MEPSELILYLFSDGDFFSPFEVAPSKYSSDALLFLSLPSLDCAPSSLSTSKF